MAINIPDTISVTLGNIYSSFWDSSNLVQNPPGGFVGLSESDVLTLHRVGANDYWTEDGTNTPSNSNRIKVFFSASPNRKATVQNVVNANTYAFTTLEWTFTACGSKHAKGIVQTTSSPGTYNFKDIWTGTYLNFMTCSVYYNKGGGTPSTTTGSFAYNPQVFSNMGSAGTAPSITVQPVSQTKNPGQSVTFTVTATGTEPLTYQWRKNGSPIGGAPDSSSYTIASVQESDEGDYSCYITNAYGNDTSTDATLTVNDPVVFTTQPQTQNVDPGETATFTVAATGETPITYQWQKNQVNITGQTSTTLSLSNVTEGDEGLYRCVATNVVGSYNSNEARLTVSFVPGPGGVDSPRDTIGQPPANNTTVGAIKSFYRGILSFGRRIS